MQQSIVPTNATQTWFYTLRATTHLKSGIYSIRLQEAGLKQSPKHKPPIHIVYISDTHTNTVPIPPGDLLVHAAVLTNASQPHKKKIALAGNHDSYFDVLRRCEEDRSKKLDFKDTLCTTKLLRYSTTNSLGLHHNHKIHQICPSNFTGTRSAECLTFNSTLVPWIRNTIHIKHLEWTCFGLVLFLNK
jgi:hypothetical protein